MRRSVRWTHEALNDIKQQIAVVATDNREAALRVADRIRDAAAALGRRANGRPGRVNGTYKKSVAGLSYVIAYSLAENAGAEAVVILRVIHTARNWPSDEWPG